MGGDRHNPNVELVAQGVANIASPLFGGLPATGAIARTATNIRSGARTPVSGMIQDRARRRAYPRARADRDRAAAEHVRDGRDRAEGARRPGRPVCPNVEAALERAAEIHTIVESQAP
jgi:hypothetical protein